MEVSGTTLHSALVEEERKETRERRAKESSSSRKGSGQAKGQAKDQGQKERVVVRKMDAGRAVDHILGMSALKGPRMVVRKDTLVVLSRLVLLEACVQWERACVCCQRCGAKTRSSWYLGTQR